VVIGVSLVHPTPFLSLRLLFQIFGKVNSNANMTIGDDVCLPRVSFNSTLESLLLQLCSQPLTRNSLAIDRLGNLPGRSCALDLIPSLFFYKKAPTPIGPPHFMLLPSSLDLDLAI
jgi:hypothetical protein